VAAKHAESTSQADVRQPLHRLSDVLGLYPSVRDDHLRTLQKCGLLGAPAMLDGERFASFADVVVIRQVHAELQRGAKFKAVMRMLLASRDGQLALDFRVDTQPAKVIALRPPPPGGPRPSRANHFTPAATGVSSVPAGSLAEEFFTLASSLDDGSPATRERAAEAYRQALALEPRLVPALINLANIHYAREFLIEAQALYERAVMLEPDVFEGHFNLGNIHQDLGRFDEAEGCYLEALTIRPGYPEAHLYLAVALEKAGRTDDARPHWRAYQNLAPDGEWADLAREFSE
jgi:tetratricopeptide (TPR) repeat protein